MLSIRLILPALALSLLFSGAANALERDPLFQKMVGDWIGCGTRLSVLSGQRFLIKAQVHAEIVDDRLVSRNFVEEVLQAGPLDERNSNRSYQKDYWIVPEGQGVYGLGSLLSTDPSLYAHFENSTLRLTQHVAWLVIDSVTRFNPDGTSDFEEITRQGQAYTSRVKIHYSMNGTCTQ